MFGGRTLAAFLLVLALAACGDALPPPPSPHFSVPKRPGINGVDLATDTGDVVNELKGSGLDFVARYYRDPTSRWPSLTPAEAQRLSALGLKIVAVWEFHSGKPWYFSYATGYWEGVAAWREAVAVGQPVGSAIYFAVDFNANSADMYQVDQYFRGVNAAFAAASRGRPGYRIGVYGSGAVCDAITRARLAQYSWLSNARAWAGYNSYAGWNIRQHGPFGSLSFNHDADEARGDYGAFNLAGYAPRPIPVAETLPPQPTPVAAVMPSPTTAATLPPQPTPVAASQPASAQDDSPLGAFMRSLSLY